MQSSEWIIIRCRSGGLKFFRYVSMILNIISCISGIISYILIAATINNPEAIEKIKASFAEMSGTSGMNMELFTVIAVADFLVTVYLLVLCVLVFKRMGTLAVSGYNLIVAFLISVPVRWSHWRHFTSIAFLPT